MSNDKVAATFGPAGDRYLVNHWLHTDGTRCPDFSAQTMRPSAGGNWWCLEHDQLLLWAGPLETTGEHTKAKLEDNLYARPQTPEMAAEAAFVASQLAQHTGSAIPGVPQNQYLRDMAKESAPARVSYIPLLGWPVTRGPIKPFEWYLGASVIVAILILFTFVRIFYIG